MSLIMSFSYESKPIQTIINQIKNVTKRDGIDLQPPYQRGYIWSSDFKDKLLYSVIKHYPIGSVSIRIRREINNKGALNEVVDGQQRLRTIYDFYMGNYTINSDISRKIIEYIIEYMGDDSDEKFKKLKRKLNNKGKISITYKQLPDVIRENILSYNISITNITNSSDDEITEYFRYLQNQERLRAGELLNSVPDSEMEKYLLMIDDKDNLLKKFSFLNKRKQFDRVFYSIIGLIDGQIGFGVTDKEIMKFIVDCKVLRDETEESVKYLVNVLNKIEKDTSVPINFITCNTRAMKFLLLLIVMQKVDFTNDTKKKLSALDSINQKLSAFSSAKADSVSSAFHGYSDEVIEEYRLLALISKGGHSLKRVNNRMDILAYYIDNYDNRVKASGIEPK